MVLIGELCALYSAISYAAQATILVDISKKTSPFLLNFLRMLAASMFTIFVLILLNYAIFPDDPFRIYILLMISGISGIGLGDVFYFKTLSYIGARKTILLETMAPPFTGFISWAYYGNTLSLGGWVGIFFTMLGVYIVFSNDPNSQKQSKVSQELVVKLTTTELPVIEDSNIIISNNIQLENNNRNDRNQIRSIKDMLMSPFQNLSYEAIGFLNGIAFTFCWGLSMVLSHDAAQNGTFNPVQSALLRLVAGLGSVGILIVGKKSERFHWPFDNKHDNYIFIVSIIIGSVLGIWAQQLSLLYTRPEVSQTIISSTPIFGMLFTYFKGEKLHMSTLYGSVLAVFGVGLMIWF